MALFKIKGIRKEDLKLVAEDLGEEVLQDFKTFDLKELILQNEIYKKDPDFVTDLLVNFIAERKEKQERGERKEKQEREERERKEKQEREFELEKMKIENQSKLEMARIEAEAKRTDFVTIAPLEHLHENGTGRNSLEDMIRSIRTLTIPVPTKPEAWNLFFTSLEKAFKTKNVPEDKKVEILLNLLGERANNILTYIKEDELDSYEVIKTIVLREFEPSAQSCLDNFRKARRHPNETHVQFVSRLTASWEYYCKLRKATDLESVNKLIISDRLFQALDQETAAHICIRQGDSWFRPIDLAKECDIFFVSKGKSFAEIRSNNNDGNMNKYVPPPLRKENSLSTGYDPKYKRCYICNEMNHIARNCTQRAKRNLNYNQKEIRQNQMQKKRDVLIAKVKSNQFKGNEEIQPEEKLYIQPLQFITIFINGHEVEAILDSGTQIPVLHAEDVQNYKEECGSVILKSAFGEETKAPMVKVQMAIKSDERLLAPVEVIVALTDKLKGPCLVPPEIFKILQEEANVIDVSDIVMTRDERSENSTTIKDQFETPGHKAEMCLVNKSDAIQINEELKGNIRSGDADIMIHEKSDKEILREEQFDCVTLRDVTRDLKQGKGNFVLIDNIIYHKDKVLGETVTQLVLPLKRRKKVLELAHESIFGAHMGIRKTKERIRYSFYWPNMVVDISEYCKTCKQCQLRSPKKISDRAPITPVARPELPFQVINIDVIGPIDPPSARGHKYILCLVDQHTRWPEAVPMKSLSAKSTCEVLLQIFCRTGIPNVIASDQGTNFTSSLTKEFMERIGSTPRFSCPGYAASNGLVERWNKVLKDMLHHVIRHDPKNWDKHIPYLLFAYREVPNCTTGISPFRLLYGREARGPLSILKSTWTGEMSLPINISESATEYLQNLKIQLENAAEQASVMAAHKQKAYAEYFNRRSSVRNFEVGDQVILLIPDSSNKLYARWTGPGEIIQFCPPYSYKVKLPCGKVKHVHVNKIKRYYPRVNAVGVIFEDDIEFGEIHSTPKTSDSTDTAAVIQSVELKHLKEENQQEIRDILYKHKSLFTSQIRIAKVGEHKIRLKPNVERKKPYIYRIPETLKPKVDEQIEELLALDLIEESHAEIAHPVVCVNKKDGGLRLCVDYRTLNAATVTDDFPMEDATQLIHYLGRANVISTLDLLKGYWAIPMEAESRDYTSFRTHRQQYRFKVMSFGLKNAAATFQREMNRALDKYREFSRAYIDDIAIFSPDWKSHLLHLDIILEKLEELQFTVNINKCAFAKGEVKYLGHIIGSGKHKADPDKVQAIVQLSRPENKKQLRSFLGLCNYYREYIPHYAEIAFPLTELTGKRVSDILPWTDFHDKAFDKLKSALMDVTALHAPILGKPFIIQSDASMIGIAACLSQKVGERICPISYASQKLTKTQQAWSTIEREAFAIVWSLKKFECWIFGAEIEFYTDHNPLSFLTKCAPQSPRLQRWAFALQRYNISVKHCPGSLMSNADALSRLF